MTVNELILELSKHPSDARVVATWESIFMDVSVYVAKDCTVILDADNDSYRDRIESGALTPPPVDEDGEDANG